MARLAFPLLLAFTCVVAVPATSEGWGEWKGRIVDAETKEPIEGVVVLAYWLRSRASVGGWADSKVTDVEETVTGPDGRFSLPSHMTYTIPLTVKVDGPDTTFFKAGYGRPVTEYERNDEVVYELRPLKTREERVRHFQMTGGALATPGIPQEKTRRLREARDAEAKALGLTR